MKVTDLYQLLNPIAFVLLAILFFLLARTRSELRSAYWFSAAYIFAACGFTLGFFLPYLSKWVNVLVTTGFYLGATLFVSIGLIKYADKRVPIMPYALATCAGVLLIANFQLLAQNRQAAQISSALVTASLILPACFIAWSSKARRRHKAVVAVYAVFGVSFLGRAALILGLGGLTKIAASPDLLGILKIEELVGNLLALLCAFTILLAYAARLLSLIGTEANTDPLTGLRNRRGFYKDVDVLRARAKQEKMGLFLILADMDKFKTVNDLYGHATGDKLICRTGKALKEAIGQRGTVARIGGEEFAVTLLAESLQAAALIANRMRISIENLPLNTDDGPRSFTISMGVGQHVDGERIEQTQDRTDSALYLAKDQGRNRVVTQEDLAIFKLKQQIKTDDENLSLYRDTA